MEERAPELVEEVHRVDELAVDVQLELVGSGIADPHRRRASVAFEVVEDLLGQVGPTVDPVHDLQRTVRGRGSV